MRQDDKLLGSNKRMIILGLCIAAVVALAFLSAVSMIYVFGQRKMMDRSEALKLALEDAEVSERDITVIRQKLEQTEEGGYFAIVFQTEEYVYDYKIDAVTGKAIGVNIEARLSEAEGSQDLAIRTVTQQLHQEKEQIDQGNQQFSQAKEQGTEGNQQMPQDKGQGAEGNQQMPQDKEQGTEGNQQMPQDKEQGTEGNQQMPQDKEQDVQRSELPQGGGESQSVLPRQEGAQSQQPQGQGQKGLITLEEAKTIVLSDAGVTADGVTFKETKWDRENGMDVYDIEFYTLEAEYDYEINAATGAVIGRQMDRFQQGGSFAPGGTGNGDTYIRLEQAKEIALEHAGVNAADVYFTKAELDYEEHSIEYEIEFEVGRIEYEYSIDAYSGTILDFEHDVD